MKKQVSRRICMMMLCLIMIMKAHSTALWVGQSEVCDAASAVVGLTRNVSWSCTGGYINMTGSGFSRNVTATQYWSGTAYVTCTWEYRLTANSTWHPQSKTWTFTCQENPVHITPTEMTLSVGQTASVGYYHEYNNIYTAYANTYFSCSGNVVSVTRDGTVTALTPGTAYINVYSNISNAANAPYCTVTVRNPAPQSVSIDSPIEIDADVSRNLSASVYPSNASVSSTEWSIQEGSECISLTPSGYLTGIKPGTAKIYCTVNNSIVSNTATVIVSEPPFNQKSSVPLANTTGVSAFVTPSVTFSSSLFEGDNFSTICLKDSDTGKIVSGTVTINGSTLRFTPTNPLAEQTNYIFVIPANAVKNKWGTHYSSIISIPFKTGDWEKLTLTMTPASGLVTIGTSVVLHPSVPSANIYYTINGSNPTKQSLLYTSPIIIEQDVTIKAVAIADGYHSSEVVEEVYQVTSLTPLTESLETIYKKAIPSIKFSSRIKAADHFEDIQLLKGNVSITGECLIVDSTLHFVPQEELETGVSYTLNIPEMAIVSFQEGYNNLIQKIFKVRMDAIKPIIVAGNRCSFVIKDDGSLWAWGYNNYGQLGDGTTTTRTTPVKVLDDVEMFTNGFAIKSDRTLWAWRYNEYGRIGDGTTNNRCNPAKILDNVVCIATSDHHTLAVKKDGSLWAWGYNGVGEVGDGTYTVKKNPVKVMENVVSVETGFQCSFAIKSDRSLWAWGNNSYGQLGDGTTTSRNTPVKVLDDVIFIESGGDNGFAIRSDGSLWAWGYNSNGRLGDGTATNQISPVKILDDVVSVSAGGSHTLALKKDGSFLAWGSNYDGELGDGTTSYQTSPVKLFEDYKSVKNKGEHVLATKDDNSLWSWGGNYWGQLGDGTKNDRIIPIKVLDDVTDMAAGYNHNLAVKNDGTLWAWGYNRDGQLGDGTKNSKLIPEEVFDDVISVSTGGNSTVSYSMAVRTDGSLWAWGYNSECQLGDGTTTTKTSPVKVLDNVLTVTTGYAHTLALKQNGSLWGWGRNCFGQLGDGSSTMCSLPEKILDDVVFVSAGQDHTLAIKNDGSLWTWGYNNYGQLGDGTTTNRLTPTKLLDGVSFVVAGESHSLAIKNDGSLWAWGNNNSGQLGDGTTTKRTSPVKVLDDVACVTAGNINTFAIKNDGSIWGWGYKSYQLGIDPYEKVQPHIELNSDLLILKEISLRNMLQLQKDEQSLLVPQYTPSTAEYESMSWTSNDENIATVTDRGIVTGIAPGETTLTVTVTSTQGEVFTGSCTVMVTHKTDVTTASHSIVVDYDDASVYNLQGQRVKQPSKGIFIRSGKKEVKR